MSPSKPLNTRLIHISRSYQTIYRSVENILEWELSIGLEFKSKVLCKSIAWKKHSIWYELYLKKYLIPEGSSGSNWWARVKRERMHSRERLLGMKFFDSANLQNGRERPDMKRKYMNNNKP